MSRSGDNNLATAALVMLIAVGIGLLAFLVLAPNFAQARLNGLQPVSLLSGRQANYAMDPAGMVVRPINLNVVAQVVADRTTSTLPVRQQAATLIGSLKTPVFTITPMIGTMTASPTLSARNYTMTALAFTFTPGASPTGPAKTAAGTLTATQTPTRPRLTLPPIETITLTPTWTATPSQTNTLVPTPPGTTATVTPRPSSTPMPTPTKVVSATPWLTATPTFKPTATLPSFTSTPQPSSTPWPTATRTLVPPTATWTSAPTATWTPVPPTRTKTPIPPTSTLPAYPPPSTPTTAPYP